MSVDPELMEAEEGRAFCLVMVGLHFGLAAAQAGDDKALLREDVSGIVEAAEREPIYGVLGLRAVRKAAGFLLEERDA